MAELVTVYDSINIGNAPAGSYLMAYGNGAYRNVAEAAAHGTVVGYIDVLNTMPGQWGWLDIENGDASVNDAEGWYGTGIYCNLSTWPDVLAAMSTLRSKQMCFWIADYTEQPHLPQITRSGVTYTAAGCQYQGGPTAPFDVSVFQPSVLNIPQTSNPPEAAVPTLNQDIVSIVPTTTNGGYWLVASDGGVFSFGDAAGFAANPVPNLKLNRPIVDAKATTTNRGLWLVGGDGGVFALGDAAAHGSLPAEGVTPAPEAPIEH